jgi:hypothetical protein
MDEKIWQRLLQNCDKAAMVSLRMPTDPSCAAPSERAAYWRLPKVSPAGWPVPPCSTAVKNSRKRAQRTLRSMRASGQGERSGCFQRCHDAVRVRRPTWACCTVSGWRPHLRLRSPCLTFLRRIVPVNSISVDASAAADGIDPGQSVIAAIRTGRDGTASDAARAESRTANGTAISARPLEIHIPAMID